MELTTELETIFIETAKELKGYALRGFIQGIPTLHLAKELNLDYETLLDRRHRIQRLALENKPTGPLPDDETEGDEMFQNAGEKGTPHRDPDDPPRRRANERPGLGTMENA